MEHEKTEVLEKMIELFKPEGTLLHTAENREFLSSPSGLERAMSTETILEGVAILCDSDLCLHVELPCAHGIIEPEEAVYCREGDARKDIAIITRVGKPIAFCVLSLENKNGELIAHLSRRMAQKKCTERYLSSLRPGDLIPSKVTHMEPFGAFLDIGCGVSSLLSVDCISVSRIAHPKDRLKCGDSLTVAVKSADAQSGRIYVTLKELLGTWEENARNFKTGQTVSGIVRSVESYGVFVELAPNLAGLAELREGSATELQGMIGKRVAVYIKSIVPERMKIKLILVDSCATETPPPKLKYYVDTNQTKHLSRWIYSPENGKKVVETVFD